MVVVVGVVVVIMVVVEIRHHYLSCKKEANIFRNVKGLF